MNPNLSILYVEDEVRSRKVMEMLLKRRLNLSNVTIFENSEDFLARAEAIEPKPDIVFLDIHVPPLNGFEMLDILRQSQKFADTPIIALTASVMNEEVHKLRAAGFNGCLSKPLDMDTFPELMERLLEREEIWRITG